MISRMTDENVSCRFPNCGTYQNYVQVKFLSMRISVRDNVPHFGIVPRPDGTVLKMIPV